ncbi:hypothetical protein C8F04DRAFT_1105912 [Mycena alexandri]|uniref:Secreted protein n=1 Tax=Mycena alexandri TaxID=1745969 RepID=A0AAD6SSU9_9AGAR|nr:hypothetical protein C8F04DRAFT_1105912 [Mycena alexandri]
MPHTSEILWLLLRFLCTELKQLPCVLGKTIVAVRKRFPRSLVPADDHALLVPHSSGHRTECQISVRNSNTDFTTQAGDAINDPRMRCGRHEPAPGLNWFG